MQAILNGGALERRLKGKLEESRYIDRYKDKLKS
jgi:hypothetical protein